MQSPKQLANLSKGKATRFSGEVAVKSGKKGAARSHQVQREKKTMAQLVTMMMDRKLTETTRNGVENLVGTLPEDDATYATAMVAGQMTAAIKGNTFAFKTLCDQVEAERVRKEAIEALKQKTYHIDLDIIPDNFHGVIRDIRHNKHRTYVLKGGRGSSKSSTFAQEVPELMRNFHDIHAVVVRKVGNTLKDSVFSKIKWAINMQESDELFSDTKNPMEITLNGSGQKIYFRGADKKEKIKSIAPEFGYIAILWIEEADQLSGPEELRSIIQSVIRGGEHAWIFISYNPPKQNNHWINQWVEEYDPQKLVHTSTYLEVPPEWLGEPFIEEAERLKIVNPDAYDHEYMGKSNGQGGMVFDYLTFREITDEEISHFDRIYQGVDWGWYPDIYAFVRLHYDVDTETIYIFDEITNNKTSNEENARKIIDKGYDDFEITCDSSEKKSVNDFRDLGLKAKPAIKGPGSVEYTMKWLQCRKIVIDPERTPVAYEEFRKYEYERDKDGNVLSGYPDANNHVIDATRYALERFANKKYNHA